MSKEQTPIENRSRMSFLDEATKNLSNGVHETFEETCMYGFDEISKVVYYAMNLIDRHERKKTEQYAQSKVLEALEREAVDIYFAVRKGCTKDPFKTAEEHAKNYIETEVKPKYE